MAYPYPGFLHPAQNMQALQNEELLRLQLNAMQAKSVSNYFKDPLAGLTSPARDRRKQLLLLEQLK